MSEPSEMVKRVAAAIDAAEVKWMDEQQWTRELSLADMPCEIKARAAIEAMRHPTPAMILANSDAGGPDDQATIDDWNAMIDAALA